jgi:hypothetical protein
MIMIHEMPENGLIEIKYDNFLSTNLNKNILGI